MSSTAANVLFGYWSHDIGGNHNGSECPGDSDPSDLRGAELLARYCYLHLFWLYNRS
jgi:hypothetical protein